MNQWWQICWWVGIALALLALVVMAFALFRDRSRGRRRCPKCWYDMSGVTGMSCPECGRTQSDESRFFRTRRRWAHATAGLVLLVLGGTTAVGPLWYTGEWVKHVPPSLLQRVLPLFKKEAAAALAKFERRMVVSSLTPWERTLLASSLRDTLRSPLDPAFMKAESERRCYAFAILALLGEHSRIALPELATGLEAPYTLFAAAGAHHSLGVIAQENGAALARALDRPAKPWERRRLIEALVAVGGPNRRNSPVLREVLASASLHHEFFEDAAVWMMADASDPAIVEMLENEIADGSPRARIIAIRLLGILAHSRERGTIQLEGTMTFTEEVLFLRKLRAFPAGAPSRDAIEAIRRALTHEDPEVRQQAEYLLKGITPW